MVKVIDTKARIKNRMTILPIYFYATSTSSLNIPQKPEVVSLSCEEKLTPPFSDPVLASSTTVRVTVASETSWIGNKEF